MVAKVLEKLLPFNILYRETSVITHIHQGTYQHDKSTEGILLVAVDAIAHHMERGESMCASCLCLCKVFDSLDHCILLHQLSNLGCPLLYCDGSMIICLNRLTVLNTTTNSLHGYCMMKGEIPQNSACPRTIVVSDIYECITI